MGMTLLCTVAEKRARQRRVEDKKRREEEKEGSKGEEDGRERKKGGRGRNVQQTSIQSYSMHM